MPRNIVERLLERAAEEIVDLDNFQIKGPFRGVISTSAHKAVQAVKHSKAAKIIEGEKNLRAIKNLFVKKYKPEEMADPNKHCNFYTILDVSSVSTPEEIKKAFRTLAIKWHPDKHANNPKVGVVFAKIKQAGEILSDPVKRALYDEFGEQSLKPAFNPQEARKNRFGGL